MYEHFAQVRFQPSRRRVWWHPRVYALSWAIEEASDSFTFRIFWLGSACAYGITDIFLVLAEAEGMDGNRNEWGFGQIVPLVLLLLPLLTATQSLLGMLVSCCCCLVVANRDTDYRSAVLRRRQSGHTTSAEPKTSISTEELAPNPAHCAEQPQCTESLQVTTDPMPGGTIKVENTSGMTLGEAQNVQHGAEQTSIPARGASPPPPVHYRKVSIPTEDNSRVQAMPRRDSGPRKWALPNQHPRSSDFPHRVDAISWREVRTLVYIYTAFMAAFTLLLGIALTGLLGSLTSVMFIVIAGVETLRTSWGSWRLKKVSKRLGNNTDPEMPGHVKADHSWTCSRRAR